MPHHGRVRRWWPFVLVVAVCAPGLLGAFDWLENSDVLRYAEMSTGRGTDAPWSYRLLVPWLASLLPLAPLVALRVVSLAATLGALAGVLRIVEHVGGDRRAAALLFATSFGVVAFGASGYTEPAVLCALAWGTWAVLAGRWEVFAVALGLGTLVSEKAALLLLVAAASRPRWALGGAGLFVLLQLVVRGGVGEIWAPSVERISSTTGLGRWLRIALTLGVPALLAVPRLRNAPRPLVVGLAGVAALLVYAVVAARVDGRFALLALPFTVPESSLVTVRSSSWWPWRSTNCSAPEPNAPRAKRSPR